MKLTLKVKGFNMIEGIVTVKFIDGETLCFSDVEDFGYKMGNTIVYVRQNGLSSFFNASQVKYIGRV